jgi:hypothetical protein
MKRIRVNHYTKEIVGSLRVTLPLRLFEQMDYLTSSFDPHVITRLALETFFHYRYAIYVIWSPKLRIYTVGVFEWHEVTDIACHFLYSYGPDSIGEVIRSNGIGSFKFKVLGRFKDEKIIKQLAHSCHKKLESKGYKYKEGFTVLEV